MTSDELNRTIDFIIQSQARLTAAQEQDRADRIKFEEWSKSLFARMDSNHERLGEILAIQSRRLDRAEMEDRAAQKRHEELMLRIDAGLDRIFAKLPDRNN